MMTVFTTKIWMESWWYDNDHNDHCQIYNHHNTFDVHNSNHDNTRVSQMWALLAACRELAVDYTTLPEVLYVYEHKT